MEEKEYTFFVKKQQKIETETGTKYSLRLLCSKGHYLVLKSESASLFEGFPIGQAVSVELKNPQHTLPGRES